MKNSFRIKAIFFNLFIPIFCLVAKNALSESEPNNWYDTADTLLDNSIVVTGTLGNGDIADFYNVVLNQDANEITITLSVTPGFHAVLEFDSPYNCTCFFVNQEDLSSITITGIAAAGTYSLVLPRSGPDPTVQYSYSLSCSSIPTIKANDPEPNDNQNFASSLLPNITMEGHIGYTNNFCDHATWDKSDWWIFQTTSTNNFEAEVVNNNGNPVTLRLKDAWLNEVSSNSGNGVVGISISGLVSGSYYLVVESNQWGNYSEYALSYCTSPTISIFSDGNTTVCKPSMIILGANVTGTAGTYQWKKGNHKISGATNATYSASKTDSYSCIVTNACGSDTSNSISVIVNAQPTATITPSGTVNMCAGQTTVLTANAGNNLSYQWKKGSNNIAGATNQTYSATAAGKYKVTVTNSSTGCTKNSKATTINITCKQLQLSIANSDSHLSVFPNPGNEMVSIEFSSVENQDAQATIRLLSVTGQLLFEEKIQMINGKLQQKISLSPTLPDGIYLLQVKVNDEIYAEKVVLEK